MSSSSLRHTVSDFEPLFESCHFEFKLLDHPVSVATDGELLSAVSGTDEQGMDAATGLDSCPGSPIVGGQHGGTLTP